MPGPGVGVPTQIVINGAVTIPAPFSEGFTVTPERDSYDSAALVNMKRGSGRYVIAGRHWDYSALATLAGYAAANAEYTTVVTYVGAATDTFVLCRFKVLPALFAMQGLQGVYLGAAGAVDNNLDAGTGWTPLGLPLGDVQPAVSTNDHTTGRKPHHSWVKVVFEDVMFPDVALSDIDTPFNPGDSVKLAFKFGADLYLVFAGLILTYFDIGAQDGNAPRCVAIGAEGVATTWGALFAFHNGSAAAVTEPGDKRFGFDLEIHCTYLSSIADVRTMA